MLKDLSFPKSTNKPCLAWKGWSRAPHRSQRLLHLGTFDSPDFCNNSDLRMWTKYCQIYRKTEGNWSLLAVNVMVHGQQRVQTLFQSHDLEPHITGGQEQNTDSVTKTCKCSAQIRINNIFEGCKSCWTHLCSHTQMSWDSQKQVDDEQDVKGFSLGGFSFGTGSECRAWGKRARFWCVHGPVKTRTYRFWGRRLRVLGSASGGGYLRELKPLRSETAQEELWSLDKQKATNWNRFPESREPEQILTQSQETLQIKRKAFACKTQKKKKKNYLSFKRYLFQKICWARP